MPAPLLNVIRREPVEREHEGWATWAVNDYFESAGQSVCVWALGGEEPVWNADDLAEWDGKLFGLQFKMPHLDDANEREGFEQIKWSLQSVAQFNDIKASNKSVFYCLPTFVNREWRKTALHHAIIWYPGDDQDYRAELWYDKPDEDEWWAKIEKGENSYRWGNFIERLQNCEFGWQIQDGEFLRKSDKKSVRQFLKTTVGSKSRGNSTKDFAALVQVKMSMRD